MVRKVCKNLNFSVKNTGANGKLLRRFTPNLRVFSGISEIKRTVSKPYLHRLRTGFVLFSFCGT
ncbi:MAG: hypothetical protein LBP85_09805 [Prevotellaceae bacterium]|nr:hypothetical protein [Prevotellaceae bacterium]